METTQLKHAAIALLAGCGGNERDEADALAHLLIDLIELPVSA